MTNQIDPYSLSTFGRAHTQYLTMEALATSPETSADTLKQQWAALQPLLSKLFCEAPTSALHIAPSFLTEHYTGMASPAELQLPSAITSAWDRLRVLQGLLMHLQLWIFFGAFNLQSHPTSTTASYYSSGLGNLISTIADLLECCEALPDDIEDWAAEVIAQCTEEAEEMPAPTDRLAAVTGLPAQVAAHGTAIAEAPTCISCGARNHPLPDGDLPCGH